MKKIKLFLAGLLATLSAFLCFGFASCKAQEGKFSERDVEYYFSVYPSLEDVSVSYSFKVFLPSNTAYEIEYEATVLAKGSQVASETKKRTLTPNGEDVRTISEYWHDILYIQGTNTSDYTLKIKNVTITPKKSDDTYIGYAIGFGTVGGAALIASVVLFIVLKKKEK